MTGRAAEPVGPILSRRHPLLVRVRKLARHSPAAREEAAFLLDGIHLLEEALRSPHAPEAILVAPRLSRTEAGRRLHQALQDRRWPLHAVSDELFDDLAATQTPQGVLGLFARPAPRALPAPAAGAPLAALVLAGLQDPLNLGALARSAWAFGCPLLVTTAATVDPFHPRALRASSGALLHLAVSTDVEPGALRDWLARHALAALALVPRGGRPLEEAAVPFSPGGAVLLLGSEGRGLPAEIEELCTERLTITMRGDLDSLGVAAAGSIALHSLSRERR